MHIRGHSFCVGNGERLINGKGSGPSENNTGKKGGGAFETFGKQGRVREN